MLQRPDMKRVAAAAKVDLRTVRNAYEGKSVRALNAQRIAAAAKALGLQVPQHLANVEHVDASDETNLGLKGPPRGPDAGRPWVRVAFSAAGIKPSLKAFVELPIQVKHAWESYPVVDEAIAVLEETGQFQNAAMLVDAARSDDRVTGVSSTRVNGVFGLPMEFKWQGQEDYEAAQKAAASPAPQAPAVGEPPAPAPAAKPAAPPIGQPPAAPTAPAEPLDPEKKPEVVALKQRVCKLVEDNWKRMLPTATAKEVLEWAILLNSGIGELVWAWEGELVIPTLKSWHPQFLYWRWDTRSYWLIHEGGQTELAPGDGRWVFIAPFGHNHGWLRALIRSIGKLWIDRMFLWRDWARAAEKFALGIMKISGPEDADTADKDAIRSAVADPASETSVWLPKREDGKQGFDLEMLETQSSGVNTDAFFETRLKRIDTCIAVAVLGQNLTTESGDKGTRALGQVHENIRADFLKADVEVVQDVAKTQVVSPFVRYNFEAEAEALGVNWKCLVPDVTWKVDPPEDQSKTADALDKVADGVAKLKGSGAPVDTHAVLVKYGIPVIDEKKAPAHAPPSPGGTERPRGPGGDLPEDQPPGIGTEERPDGEGDQPLEPERPDTATLKDDIGNRKRQGLKPGGRKGQVLVDDLADVAKKAGAKAMAQLVRELAGLVEHAADYDDLRAKVKAHFLGMKPGSLRQVMEKALVIAELTGHLSARVDHQGVKT